MTSIVSTSDPFTPTNQSRTGLANESNASAGQFETFLKMLTTQIKNQDPLNPMEGTEFAVQLATFSGVEQQVQTNLLLNQLLQGSSGGELGQLAGWIGREVRTSAPVWYQQTPLTLEVDAIPDADAVTLVAINDQGQEVSRENIGTASGEVDWQGRLANGDLLPAGLYSFRIDATKDGELVGSRKVQAYTRIVGAELTATGPRFLQAGGGFSSVEEVTALRD